MLSATGGSELGTQHVALSKQSELSRSKLAPGQWALIALCGLVFAPGIPQVAEVWDTTEYYTFGYLVPLVSFMLAYANRMRASRRPVKPDARGWSLIGVSFLVYLVGFLASSPTLIGVGTVGAIASGVLALYGVSMLKVFAFPIGYLLFCVPLPAALIGSLTTALRLIAADVSLMLFQLAELPVMREGNVIAIPEGRLFVDEACSGITSIVTLSAAATLLAFFTQNRWSDRLLLIFCVVPIAMFWNLVRITGTVAAALEIGIPAAIDSSLHEFAGLLTFSLGCGCLLLADTAIRRVRTRLERRG